MIKKVLKKIYHKLPIKEETRVKIRNVIRKDKQEKLTKEEFIKKLEKYKVISFDIFDTLITRKIYNPDDLFNLMEQKVTVKDFKNIRKQSEIEANEFYKKDVNLDEIYQRMNTRFIHDDKTAEKIKQMEIDYELKLCIPRKDMLEIFNYLKSINKKIILVSDMYLNKDIIEKMLEICGYSGYEKLYLSNDINKRKDTCEMWKFVSKKYRKIVHIGDNISSDYINPKKYKISALKIESGKEKFKEIDGATNLENLAVTPSNSIFLGNLVNNLLFNEVFEENQISSLEQFGYVAIGPMIYEFMKFLYNSTNEDNKLCFLAREGYQLQKLYNDFCKICGLKMRNSLYFLASRRATTNASIEDESDIYKLCDKDFNGSVNDFFVNVLGIKEDVGNKQIILPKDKDYVINKINEFKTEILNNSKMEQDNYLSYIKKQIGNDDNLFIVDLGYSGTIQYHLSKLLKEKKIIGYYLTNSENVKKYSQNNELNFCFDRTKNPLYDKIYSYSLTLEFFLCAPYGQLLYFEKKGQKVIPVYNDECPYEEKKEKIVKIYDGVVSYMKDTFELEKNFNISISKDILAQSFIFCIESSILSKELKNQFTYLDLYNDTEEYNLFKKIGKY